MELLQPNKKRKKTLEKKKGEEEVKVSASSNNEQPKKEVSNDQPKKEVSKDQPKKEVKVSASSNNEQPKKEEKKEPQKKQQDQSKQQPPKGGKDEKDKPIDVSRLDIRVGKIVNVKKHESAESLYVEEIDIGEGKPRTVVSGLVKFVPMDQMQDRYVIVLCNLKPAKLRGVTSEAMVLAASNSDHTQVELLDPPSGVKIGERVTFDGFSGEADEQLNPKHKIWEAIQPDFATLDDCTAVWKGIPFKASTGLIKVKTISKGTIK